MTRWLLSSGWTGSERGSEGKKERRERRGWGREVEKGRREAEVEKEKEAGERGQEEEKVKRRRRRKEESCEE